MIQNNIVRNFAKLLLILLIVAFVFWGLGDAFRTRNENYAIKIDDIEYSHHQWNEIVGNNIRETKVKYGKELSSEEIASLKQHLANQIVDSTLLYIEAKNLGISVNDNMVKKEILKIPVFSKDGRFNKNQFDQIIHSYGLSEEAFIAKVKEELVRNVFIGGLSSAKIAIPELTKSILQGILESKQVELIKIPFAAFNILATAPKEALKAIYEQNKVSFKVPEKRIISYIRISSDNIKNKNEEIDEKALYQIYQQKSFLFTEPEKRVVKQIQFNSLDIAKKAHSEIMGGADFDLIAKKYSPTFKNVDLGVITAKDFEGEISVNLFKLKKEEVSNIIETPLGLYIFKVTNIIPPKTKKYDDVKEVILKEYIKEVRSNKFLTMIKDIQNELKDAKSIDAIALTYNLKLERKEIYQGGNDDAMLDNKVFIENAFKTGLNSVSSLFSINSKEFCVLKVDEITPESLKNFEEVQDELEKIWHDQEIVAKAQKLSFDENDGYKSKDNQVLVNLQDITTQSIVIARDEMNQNLPADFLQELLSLKKDQLTKPYIDKPAKIVLLGKLRKVTPPSFEKTYKYKNLYDHQILKLEQEAIISEILQQLRKKYKVIIGSL